MEDKAPSQDFSNTNLNQKSQISDYEYLLIKLKEIKDSITLLENNFLFREF